MSEKYSVGRNDLLKTLTLLKPVLATKSYIKALTHIRFDGNTATAYNDISAIAVPCEVPLNCCLPGELLIAALTSFGGAEVTVVDNETEVILSSGRAKIKLPALTANSFPFDMPVVRGDGLELNVAIMKGIAMCLINVGTDATHPAQMGITMDVDDNDDVVLYSTDNATISRYQTGYEVLGLTKAQCPVILPTFFCKQMKALDDVNAGKGHVNLFMDGSGYLMATFGKVTLFTKTIVDLQAMDFTGIMERHCKMKTLEEKMAPIPDGFEDAMQRSLLVLDGDFGRQVRIAAEKGSVEIHGASQLGATDDFLKFSGDAYVDEDFYIDPGHIVRVNKHCARIGFLPKVLVLGDKDLDFIHVIAHTNK